VEAKLSGGVAPQPAAPPAQTGGWGITRVK
jgi:hypothetical protein